VVGAVYGRAFVFADVQRRRGFSWSRNPPQWNGWSPDVTSARFQDSQAAGIQAAEVQKLQLKWAFDLGKVTVARSQPTIVAGRLFVGTQTGAV
jgi:hypothetical protein